MLEATEKTCALQSTHVDSCVTKHFAWRATERSRVKTVREQVAILSHDRHHGREVHVETQHPQHFARDSAERTRGSEIAVLANRARGRHRREYAAQAVDEAAFLIDAEQRRCRYDFANAVEQRAQLFGTGDVTAEDNHATR